MPIYEYSCAQCGHEFEYLQLRTSPAASCPKCASAELTQKISLYSASTEGTQKANLAHGRRIASAVHKDKTHEEHKQLHEHYDHH